jgi:hypothetical protein
MWPNDSDFRDRVLKKIQRRAATAGTSRRRMSKVNLVLRRLKQLELLQKKVQKAEQALSKLSKAVSGHLCSSCLPGSRGPGSLPQAWLRPWALPRAPGLHAHLP